MSDTPHFPQIGMSPAVWGPIFWSTMHIVSLGYSSNPSEEEKAGAIAFYRSLTQVIPCPICKSHYKYFLETMPVESAVGSRHDLIHWVFEIHNNVNEKLGKRRIRFEEYIAHMQALAASNRTVLPSSGGTDVSLLLTAAAIVGIAGTVYYYYKHK